MENNNETSSEDQPMHGSDVEKELKERIQDLEQHIKHQDDRITILETALARLLSCLLYHVLLDLTSQLLGSLMERKKKHASKKHTTSKLAKKHVSIRIYLRGRPVLLYAPSSTSIPKEPKPIDAPSEALSLEWVSFGYRGRDSRDNIYLVGDDIVYFTAGVVVSYNPSTSTQRHYLEHTDDIKSLAIHPDGVTMASGQVAGHEKNAGKPHVRIWDSSTLKTIAVIGVGEFDRAVACVAFSKSNNGDRLAVVDESNDHVLSVWEWRKKKKLLDTKSHGESVFAASFLPNDHDGIVTCGKSHICFWTIDDDLRISKRMGIFEKHPKPKAILCLAFNENNDVLSGDSNGNIFVWGAGGNRITEELKDAHEGNIFDLVVLPNGEIVSGGGRDRKLKLWDSSLKAIEDAEPVELSEEMGAPRCIAPIKCDDGRSFVVGTVRNHLIRCNNLFSSESDIEYINQGHHDELWGAGINAAGDKFVSCSYDKIIYLWNLESREVIWSKSIEEGAQSATFNPSGDLIAIGTITGKWYVLSSEDGDIKAEFTSGPEQLDVLRYSPDGKYIAVASHDNYVYIYSVADNPSEYKLEGKCSGHSSFITHIDWSKDSNYLQSTSGDYELLFWEAPSGSQVTSAIAMRDVEWETVSCVLGYSVCGIWAEGSDGTDVNAVARSFNGNLLATGDDFGMVNLFKYPCNQPKSSCNQYTGHSSHVTNVLFTPNDARLLSTGGRDNTILLWKVDSSSS
ncbi:uncharacterized protein TRIADDRAFT_63428 [Trichoplax adhaerens]|uniref:Uncharacterized protein n=1 Tax=Trichoplax adhaerens TaxID=10228 RepID=B3SAR2_TRIAD|nr:hypothetical protein TRIADDRAFT_63428 [Trichoplax adhaerens]EDV20145.1 hypothetical protein TRIADDRAFT_63428 [Trichoplax adhaerens]|eukprot:XP_002117306.1 hypothetical protein TRIADDRAFT_63428 [Trichoplax adhaerens]